MFTSEVAQLPSVGMNHSISIPAVKPQRWLGGHLGMFCWNHYQVLSQDRIILSQFSRVVNRVNLLLKPLVFRLHAQWERTQYVYGVCVFMCVTIIYSSVTRPSEGAEREPRNKDSSLVGIMDFACFIHTPCILRTYLSSYLTNWADCVIRWYGQLELASA